MISPVESGIIVRKALPHLHYPMKIALATESLKGYGLSRIFTFAKTAGFDGIDLAMDETDFDTLDPNYVKSVIAATGIPVVAVQTPKTTNKARIEEALRMAQTIDAHVIVIQPPKLFDVKLAKWLKEEIPKIRQKENISIALENASSKNMLGFIPEHSMASLGDLKRFKHVSLDTSRVAEKKDDLIRVYTTLKNYLVHIHLSNVYRGKGYAPPETGVLPIESFLSKLKQDEFAGSISFRVKPKNYHVGNDDKMLEDLKSSLTFCHKYLG